jgi:hypothetical protein
MHDAEIRLSDHLAEGALKIAASRLRVLPWGHELSIHHPGQNRNLATALPQQRTRPWTRRRMALCAITGPEQSQQAVFSESLLDQLICLAQQ